MFFAYLTGGAVIAALIASWLVPKNPKLLKPASGGLVLLAIASINLNIAHYETERDNLASALVFNGFTIFFMLLALPPFFVVCRLAYRALTTYEPPQTGRD